MKIRVSYSELVTGPEYNNKKAEAEIEFSVEGGPEAVDAAYKKAWGRVIKEVKKVLSQPFDENDLPF